MRTAGTRPLRLAALAAALAASAFAPAVAQADLCASVPPVFSGDPCDPATGPYPMMPGLPLVLPLKGPGGLWSDGEPVINTDFAGDVDIAVRVGSFPVASEVPPPAGSVSSPSLLQNIAGGGGSLQGSTVGFTVFVTDGPGVSPYGGLLPGLDQRPVAVFAYADLDGDGYVGPTDFDSSADNELEKQEALAQVGRQVGQVSVDRFRNALAVRIGAPASIGGLKVSLVAGAYTGDDPLLLWSNGTPILTNWPFFPPLDPMKVVWLDEPNPPDPSGPNILFYRTGEFYLPDPSTPSLEAAFALANDGSNPSTDQFVSLSGDAVGVRLFRDADAATFRAASRMVARPAPAKGGVGRSLVLPADQVAAERGTRVEFRAMPVDSLGNIADPTGAGLFVRVRAEGGLNILSPDADGDPYAETINVATAEGVVLEMDTDDVTGDARVTLYDPPPALPTGFDQALVRVRSGADSDTDDDGIADDGDQSGTIGDAPCTAADVVDGNACDDNCPTVVNPSQSDSDEDGQGNCCDGTCVLDDAEAGCLECPQASSRFSGPAVKVRLTIQPRAGLADDNVKLRAILPLQQGQQVTPDGEAVEVSIASGDRLHWYAQLPGAFVPDKPGTWTYEDPDGNIAGITRAQLRVTAKGVRLRAAARRMNLVDTQPAEDLSAGLVLAFTVGDDTFSRHLKCRSTLAQARCSSVD